jgi:hypothetical protein
MYDDDDILMISNTNMYKEEESLNLNKTNNKYSTIVFLSLQSPVPGRITALHNG